LQVQCNPRLVYRGPGWIGGRWREVECHADASTYSIEVPDVGVFRVSNDGSHISLCRDNNDPSLLAQALLGPAFILALALKGTWTLHTSAVMFRDRLALFIGESGFLAEQQEQGWRRVSDDLLPVVLQEKQLFVLPKFPQLKLPADAQPGLQIAEERLPVKAIYVLQGRIANVNSIQVQLLSVKQAALALVRHTVASRLFDGNLQARHLVFCAHVAQQVPVYSLAYPFDIALLPQVEEALMRNLMV
jgi:hypothetical protein